MIEIDCSLGEGGGQIIRTSLTLSALTQKPVKLFNIRKGRSNPGLAAQHLTGAKAVRSICRGDLIGAELKSQELLFHPGKIVGGKYQFNIGTAGSVILVAQTIIPILLTAQKKSIISIKGGTHVFKSPTYDYFENVFLPALGLMGAKISSKILKTSYYPKGGGEIQLTIEHSELKEITLFPNYSEINALIRLGSLPTHIGIRKKKVLLQNNIESVKLIEEKTLSPGTCVTLWCGLKGANVLGKIGKRAEDVAQEAVEELNSQLEYDVDHHLADQLLLYCSLIGKGNYSTSKVTNHLKTNAQIIKKFIDVKMDIKDNSVSIY